MVHGIASILALCLTILEMRARKQRKGKQEEEEGAALIRTCFNQQHEGSAEHFADEPGDDRLQPPTVFDNFSKFEGEEISSLRRDNSSTSSRVSGSLFDDETRDLINDLEIKLLEQDLKAAKSKHWNGDDAVWDDDPKELLGTAMKVIEIAFAAQVASTRGKR